MDDYEHYIAAFNALCNLVRLARAGWPRAKKLLRRLKKQSRFGSHRK